MVRRALTGARGVGRESVWQTHLEFVLKEPAFCSYRSCERRAIRIQHLPIWKSAIRQVRKPALQQLGCIANGASGQSRGMPLSALGKTPLDTLFEKL
jgi:hypothetical protein